MPLANFAQTPKSVKTEGMQGIAFGVLIPRGFQEFQVQRLTSPLPHQGSGDAPLGAGRGWCGAVMLHSREWTDG